MNAADCADACVFLMQNYHGNEFANIGTGEDITIREVTEIVAFTVGFKNEIPLDETMSDDMERNLLHISRRMPSAGSTSTRCRRG